MAPSKGKKSKVDDDSHPLILLGTPQTGGPATPTLPTRPQTIGEIEQGEYLASRPYEALLEKKSWNGLSADEKTAYTNFRLLESGAYEKWSAQEQKDFLKYCEKLRIPHPLPKPVSLSFREVVFREQRRKIETLSPDEYRDYKQCQRDLSLLWSQSGRFRERARQLRAEVKKGRGGAGAAPGPKSGELQRLETLFAEAEQKLGLSFRPSTGPFTEEDIEEERTRRIRIAELEGEKMPGIYEGDPLWDDVVPIPQDDGEKPLAAIAYTDEYAEAISYLRAIMAAREYSPRALSLTAHIIDLNPAHYTVWLFRASILFALNMPLRGELSWVNSVALANQKNYQIWHHRQLLIERLHASLVHDRSQVLELACSEADFMMQMFELDSKNYHVWSYRQYFVRKLQLFPSQCEGEVGAPSELAVIEALLERDVRNNSAWAHRFLVVFSDPGRSTEASGPLERDEKVPDSMVDREVAFSKVQIRKAPMNQSGWNFLRGVLRKGGRELASLDGFASEFVVLDDGKEDIKSSHALEFLADVWAERGQVEKADVALRLLGDKYDRVRKNYWEYRREGLRRV